MIAAGELPGPVVPLEMLVTPSTGTRVPLAVLDHHVQEPAFALQQETLGAPLPVFGDDSLVDDDRSIRKGACPIAGNRLVVRVVVMDAATLGERLISRMPRSVTGSSKSS